MIFKNIFHKYLVISILKLTGFADKISLESKDNNGIDCILPNLSDNIFVYYQSHPEEKLPENSSINDYGSIGYRCMPDGDYILEGVESNFCLNGTFTQKHPNCVKSCDHTVVDLPSLQSFCERNGELITCQRPYLEGTKVLTTCSPGYRPLSNGSVKDILLTSKPMICQSNGKWDNVLDGSCEVICGTPPKNHWSYLSEEMRINVSSPWNAAIYSNRLEKFKHICGGIIINARLIMTAAHCVWDVRSLNVTNSSHLIVTVGKYDKNYYVDDDGEQRFKVLQIHIVEGYRDSETFYENDIAIIALKGVIQFSHIVYPVCLKTNQPKAFTPPEFIEGSVTGFIDDSEHLKTSEFSYIDYKNCSIGNNWRFIEFITPRKFCLLNQGVDRICRGHGGSGFVIPEILEDGQQRYYLWGIISAALTSSADCDENYYTTAANVNDHLKEIMELIKKYKT